jgi:hypothetical protein
MPAHFPNLPKEYGRTRRFLHTETVTVVPGRAPLMMYGSSQVPPLLHRDSGSVFQLPCRHFADTLPSDNARRGADADRCFFTVVAMHLLLFAGFDRRTKNQVRCTCSNGSGCRRARCGDYRRRERAADREATLVHRLVQEIANGRSGRPSENEGHPEQQHARHVRPDVRPGNDRKPHGEYERCTPRSPVRRCRPSSRRAPCPMRKRIATNTENS